MRYAIGLDVGIESVGYSILELSYEDAPERIVDLGVRIFDKAEHPKTGASLALPRREARSQRRRLRRHRHRLERIYGLIASSGILSKEQLQNLYSGVLSDIYEVRTRALDEPITNEDFARIIIHLAQRRGFKSNRKAIDEADENNGKLLKAIKGNRELMNEKGYRTVGEMLYKDEKFLEYKRNKGEDYLNTIDRESIENEARLIFKAQRKFGKLFAKEEIEKKYLDILLSQRSFAEGPGAGPYSGNQIERMVGPCTFEKNEKRCAKSTYSFQLFNLWQHINHIRINTKEGSRPLSNDERTAVFDYVHNHSELTYSHIRKILGEDMSREDTFVGLRYVDDDYSIIEKKQRINDLKVYHDIRKCLNKVSNDIFGKLTAEDLDKIGDAFSKNLSDEEILKELESLNVTKEAKQQLLSLPNFPKYGHLSLKACKRIIPFLKEGFTYDKACEKAGYDFKNRQKNDRKYLPPLDKNDQTITSPVVKRSISQAIKVINAIIRRMGETSPVYINIELARELSKDLNERRKIEKRYNENAEKNETVVEQIKKYGVKNPRGQDIVKFKLWEEQAGICPYSQEYLSIERLFEPGYVDIDHIVPYSRSFDDRIVNKVLVKSSENRQKGNRLPLEYLKGEKREKYIVWINSQNYKYAKKSLLLKEKLDEEGWKQRNLQDTQFISSFLYNYISDNLSFTKSNKGKVRSVYTVNGAVTSYVRNRWGIKKIREDGDLHHAIDATVIGCISQSMINVISKYAFYQETKYDGAYKVDEKTGEAIDRFPKPWPHFLDELTIRLTQNESALRKQLYDVNYDTYAEIDLNDIKPTFVSRKSNHKVTGSAHAAQMRRADIVEGKNVTVKKESIKKLKLNKEGEIEGYYNPTSDTLLYEALKKRLKENNNNGEKAFATEMRKPKADGTDGPVVKTVKIYKNTSLVVPVANNTAVAENGDMIRCDVFYVENDGYYFVPIYVSDTVKKELPLLACVAGKKPWKMMREEDFVFSLYPNDLFKYYSKKQISLNLIREGGSLPEKMNINGEEGVLLYYKGLDISSAFISGINHDNTYKIRSIGKTSNKIEKYEVDVLGNYKKVGKEKRQTFRK